MYQTTVVEIVSQYLANSMPQSFR